ncbi:hypothetical protein COCSUDRAFT_34196 [Coccomyxa subellipsoidea C-169]|uniref:Uncharacterized protein n=1 Tax=Coccomyxa subellipsoidea (strain C-169) TaxID=574566 RepID=I0YMN1_COCSC|nr:hypothetical protein COCSUDRAFT_34196 [Coccomyxa subellipsoidea C-169]EIE19650.1 hypothetical protein COCSUDRAFT_34196 [Coccomyxa subellipsoidea C-169]|eukprot:XP_005644194.1 hypothetical protein COCSUDRAFT_34196 [Coccomyxa subellipsoidea C-169]
MASPSKEAQPCLPDRASNAPQKCLVARVVQTAPNLPFPGIGIPSAKAQVYGYEQKPIHRREHLVPD